MKQANLHKTHADTTSPTYGLWLPKQQLHCNVIQPLRDAVYQVNHYQWNASIFGTKACGHTYTTCLGICTPKACGSQLICSISGILSY